MSNPHIAVVLGTARTGSNSEHVAAYIASQINADGRADAEVYPVRDYMQDRTIPDWHDQTETVHTSSWRKVAAAADAFIMVVPEYNNGYPGEWKLVVDQDGKNYRGKPVIAVGVSSGAFMGARVVEHMQPVLVRLGFTVVHAPLYFGHAKEFAASNQESKDEQYQERIITSLDKLLLFESRLRGINALLQ